ncbi:helix-turn-helix domain-containing protein, partial [Streptococcus pluranimalium]
MEIIFNNLDRIRNKRGLSISELSNISGYSKKSISKLLSRNSNFETRLAISVRMAEVLNVDFKKLFIRGEADYGNFDIEYTAERYLECFVNNVNNKLKLNDKHRYSIRTESGLSQSTISDLLNGKTKNPK